VVTAALDALVGDEPSAELVAQALTTIPAAELPDALRLLARQHGVRALPVLRRCLRGRAEWVTAAAAALATVPAPEAAEALADAHARETSKTVRTTLRRALYRLRQAGVTPPPGPSPPRVTAPPVLREAWASAIDGTGARGLWLVLEDRHGGRTLLSAIVNDVAGILDFASEPLAKKRLDERLRALREASTLPVVSLPPDWAVRLLTEASTRPPAPGGPPRGDLGRWLELIPKPAASVGPVYAHVPVEAATADPTLLDHSAELLLLPDLGSWFLDPPAITAEALELLQARESRLVVSDQIKAERLAALVDRVIEGHVESDARRRWARRLEETAWVLWATGREIEARRAVATAVALAELDRPARYIPFVRALAERSLEIAGEVALGRVPLAEASRAPRSPVP
jgi:hypothetical protein